MRYRYNPYCSCSRCRVHGFMGPAILITLGVIFLFDQSGWMRFHSVWPALLIVIGLVMFLEHNASIAGHLPREYPSGPPAWRSQNARYGMPPSYPPQPPPVVTPPPPAPAAPPPAPVTPAAPDWSKPDDPEVHHG